ncbi:ATP-dependent helicase [Candidatus Parcubacteria bacterium]|nr:ATP-dependent helicase [Patescibacteria group bacterium]MCG2694314.1 ATP-dependent helicase [Candidatus Parcubacteria bacterium]
MIDYQKQLNNEQFEVVHEGEGPCLVLAGAGSGKTRTIIYRLAHLLEKGIEPKNICLVTFTNKAAKEMISRAEALLGYRPKGLVGGTFHHLANFLLRRYGKRIGLEPNFTIIDEDDKKSLLKSSITEAGVDTKKRRFPSPAVLKGLFSFCKNSRSPLEQVLEIKNPKFLEIKSEIEDVRQIFERKKKDGNMVDFDDLLVLTLNLLETQEDVRKGLAYNFKYVLVDEYQDTNPVQAAILYHLASHHKNILVVGDDAQSIYSFRAADIKNILDFPRTYPTSKTFRLETNYRSTPNILNLANNSIIHNMNQFPKKLRSLRKDGIIPQVIPAGTREDEANFIADRILELRDEGVELREIAVLFRASYHSEVLEMELTRRDIPYDYRGGVRFFERAHIKDVIAYLRAFFNLQDEAAWMRILSFGMGVGPATAKKIFESISEKKEPRLILDIDSAGFGIKARTSWEEILSVWKKFVNLEARPNVFIDEVINSYYKDYLENKYENADERLQDLYEMANYSSRYENLEDFLSEITLYEDVAVKREAGAIEDDERIILSTIHQAKGLEWKAVFVINLIDGAFPNRRAMLEDGGMEEERRLFYVASTRAKDELYLSYAFTGGDGGYGGGGGMYFNEPSQFLRELDRSLLEQVELENTDDSLPVIDIDAEELPKKSYLPDINIEF